MRIRKTLATGLGAIGLAAAMAMLAVPSARADVGDVSISFSNSSGQVIGSDEDVFLNLTMAQCDTNQVPSGAASATIENLTDETVHVGSSCGDYDWIVVLPLGSINLSVGTFADVDIIAPSGL